MKSRVLRIAQLMHFSPCRSPGLRHSCLRFAPASVAYTKCYTKPGRSSTNTFFGYGSEAQSNIINRL